MSETQSLLEKLLQGDGSQRPIRDIQHLFFEQLSANWGKSRIHVANLPCASGKSFIARVLQRAIGAHVITPSNILIDQYVTEYSTVNSLKGKAHYTCKQHKFYTCSERQLLFGCKCLDCKYKEAKERAAYEPTFFNPMSLYYNLISGGIAEMPLMIVDEAHSLISLLAQVTTKTFKKSDWNYPKSATTEVGFAKWLNTVYKNYTGLIQRYKDAGAKPKQILKLMEEQMQIKFLYEQFTENTADFLLTQEVVEGKSNSYEVLKLAPVTIPRSLVDKLLGHNKILFMSGTLLTEDIKELVGNEHYIYYDIDSPIPVENRQIIYDPLPSVNWETPPELIFNKIKQVLDKHPNDNTLIHLTYSMQEKLRPFFESIERAVHWNTDENKPETVSAFIKEGGILLACGLSEGLDFKGDIATVNIIPKLDFLSTHDSIIKKRRSLPNGENWYFEQTVKLFCQRVSRTTRSPTDYSVTYCFDPMLPKLIKQVKSFPNYIKKSIVWSKGI